MPSRPIHPKMFDLVREGVPPVLHEMCDLGKAIARQIEHLNDCLIMEDFDESDIAEVAELRTLIRDAHSLQMSFIHEQKDLVISEDKKKEMQEDFKNMFIGSPGKDVSFKNALSNLKKGMGKNDLVEVSMYLADARSYLKGYIYQPLLETSEYLEREAPMKFSEYTVNRRGLVPQPPGKLTPGTTFSMPRRGSPASSEGDKL
jgi:hypothetical protein